MCSKSDGLPLPKSYIKVFAKLHNGSVVFYKDGYTDLRGNPLSSSLSKGLGVFDFESLSVDATGEVNLYSILVISEHCGTTILEAQNRHEALRKLSANFNQRKVQTKKKVRRAKAFYEGVSKK